MGQAPNFKHIFIEVDHNYLRFARPETRPVPLFEIDGPVIAQSLSLPENLPRNLGLGTGFVNLRSLSILSVEFVPRFKDVAASLVSLEKVFVDMTPEYFLTAERLTFERVKRLRPLKYLSISGLEDVRLLHEILERHGATLLGLMMGPN